MGFIRAPARFGVLVEFVKVDVKHFSTTASDGFSSLHVGEIKARNKTDCQTPRIDFIRSLAHFGKAVRNRPSRCETFLPNRSQRILHTPCRQNQGSKRNWQPNILNRLNMRPTHFGVHFDSILACVELSSTMGSDVHYKLAADEIAE